MIFKDWLKLITVCKIHRTCFLVPTCNKLFIDEGIYCWILAILSIHDLECTRLQSAFKLCKLVQPKLIPCLLYFHRKWLLINFSISYPYYMKFKISRKELHCVWYWYLDIWKPLQFERIYSDCKNRVIFNEGPKVPGYFRG